MIRLPCFQHHWHDVPEVDVVSVVAALTADIADHRMEPLEPHLAYRPNEERDAYPCPLEVLGWASDVEMYYEHVQQAVIGTTGWEVDQEEGGWKPSAARDPRANGTDPKPEAGPCRACGMSSLDCIEYSIRHGGVPCCATCSFHVTHASV